MLQGVILAQTVQLVQVAIVDIIGAVGTVYQLVQQDKLQVEEAAFKLAQQVVLHAAETLVQIVVVVIIYMAAVASLHVRVELIGHLDENATLVHQAVPVAQMLHGVQPVAEVYA